MALIETEETTKPKLNVAVKFTEEQVMWIEARATKTGNSLAAIVRDCVVKIMEAEPVTA